MKKILYKCDKCGHEWRTVPPLFTELHACEIQGCSGIAYPQEECKPSGIKKKE